MWITIWIEHLLQVTTLKTRSIRKNSGASAGKLHKDEFAQAQQFTLQTKHKKIAPLHLIINMIRLKSPKFSNTCIFSYLQLNKTSQNCYL